MRRSLEEIRKIAEGGSNSKDTIRSALNDALALIDSKGLGATSGGDVAESTKKQIKPFVKGVQK